MALNGTYAGLLESVAGWLDRDDLSARIPDFVALAEARLNDDLRIGGMEVVGTGSTDALGAANLPADFLEARMVVSMSLDGGSVSQILTDGNNVSLVDEITGALLLSNVEAGLSSGASRVLRRVTPAWAINNYGSAGGLACVYTIRGSTLTVYAVQSTLLVVTYYAKIAALSVANPSNWLLTRYPNMYLYGALLEAAPYLYDDQRIGLWKAALDEAILKATRADMGARFSNGSMRLTGPTP